MKKNRTKRVRITELAMSGEFHAGVNAGLVRVMREVFPEKQIAFRGEKRHVEACRRRLSDIPTRYSYLPYFPKANTYSLPGRDLLGCLYVLYLLFTSRRGDTLLVTHLLPLTHWCLVLSNRLFRCDLFVCLHGQLEAFLPDTPLRGTKRYFRWHGPLFRKDHRTGYIVLGEPVFTAIRTLFSVKTRVIVIDHPYDYGTAAPVTRGYAFPLRFAQAGTGNRGKGTGNLFRLGELLRDEIAEGKVELHLIGRLDPEMRKTAHPGVHWREGPLSDREFESAMRGIHYTLLLRDAGCGRAVPSGSFFDSVKYGKPFLSLDSAFVTHYADRFPGGGEVYPSVEELAEAIRRICRRPDEEPYLSRVKVLEELRAGLSVAAIAENFRKQIAR